MKFVLIFIYLGLQQVFLKKKKNPMFIYRWGQGTFKRLVLKKSLVIFKNWSVFKNGGRSPSEGKYTNLYVIKLHEK